MHGENDTKADIKMSARSANQRHLGEFPRRYDRKFPQLWSSRRAEGQRARGRKKGGERCHRSESARNTMIGTIAREELATAHRDVAVRCLMLISVLYAGQDLAQFAHGCEQKLFRKILLFYSSPVNFSIRETCKEKLNAK